MSAFFICINRDGSDVSQSVAQAMLSAISEFGEDGHSLIVKDDFAIGHQHFCTVPEEQGEQQPLFDQLSNSWCVFYGRLDNRSEIAGVLGLQEQSQLSDANLVHHYLIHHQGQQLDKLIGPYSLIWFQPDTSQLIAARDPMGGRNLVYNITSTQVLVASHEMALVAHPSVAYDFNRSRVAKMLAQIMTDVDEAFIRDLKVLPPGDCLLVDGQGHSSNAFYRFDARKRVRLANDQAYADEFKRLLAQAVSRRTRSIGPIGTMLSGGMDSVPISILLAQQLAYDGETLTAFSWVYDRFPEADERRYSVPVCRQYGIEQVFINCDEVWPVFDDSLQTDPLIPFAIPYVSHQQALLSSVKRHGIRTLITGIHGDLLYGHGNSVFIELITNGEWRKCWREFSRLWSKPTNRGYIAKHMFIAQLPGVRRFVNWRRNRRPLRDELLTETINAQLQHQTPALFYESLASSRPEAYRTVLSGFAGEDQALGRSLEAHYAVERRYPFRDRDLCEFMLSIPSDQLMFNGVPRPIVKRAFKQEFSRELSQRTDKTNFTTTIIAGIQNDRSWRPWFDNPSAAWRQYVKQCYFDGDSKINEEIQVVQWRCAYYDYWKSVCYNRVANELGLSDDNEHTK